MTRDEVLANVKAIEAKTKTVVTVKKYKRSKIVQEEIVEAFVTPVPNAITVNGKTRQVEKGEWIVIHEDGTQSRYNDEEFRKVFEVIGLGKAFEEKAIGGENAKA